MAEFRYHKAKRVSFDNDDKSLENVPHGELLSKLTEFLPNKDFPSISDSREFKLTRDDLSIELSDTYIPPLPSSVSSTRFEERTRVDSLGTVGTKKDFPDQVPKVEDRFSPPPKTVDTEVKGYRYPVPETVFPPTELKKSAEDLSKEVIETYLPPLSSNTPLEVRAGDRGKAILNSGRKFHGQIPQLNENFPLPENFDSIEIEFGSRPRVEVNKAETTLRNNNLFHEENVQPKSLLNEPFFVPTFRVKSDEIEISKEFLDSREVKTLNRFTPILAKSKKDQFAPPNNGRLSKSIRQFKESKENLEFGFKPKKKFPNDISRSDSKDSLRNEFGEFQKELNEFNDLRDDEFRKFIAGKDFTNNVSGHSKVDNKTASLIFVLLGSLAPLLQLGNHSTSPHLTNFLKQDIPASVIHIPRLAAGQQFQQLQERVDHVDPLAKSFTDAFSSSSLESCTNKYFSFDCQNFKNGFCLEDPNFPLSDIKEIAKDDPTLFPKYAEVQNQSADDLVPSIRRRKEENFDYSKFNPFVYDETHWFGPEGYICPSNVTYGRPIRARTAKGQWKFILNDDDSLTQTLRLETCLFSNAPCRLVAPCFKSKCVQKYSYHRLLSFDPCEPSKGFHNDIYRLPSACSCYAPEFHSFDEFLSIEFPNKKAIGKPLIN